MKVEEPFLTLYCDPGEDFGWVVGKGTDLLAGGTHKMWDFADLIWDKLQSPEGDLSAGSDGLEQEPNPLSSGTHIRDGVDPELMRLPIGRIVCEDFRIYPWKVNDLKFDQVRTARVIGAITFMCRQMGLPFKLQGANIKAGAEAAGAPELFWRPLRENRHQNDALMHYVWYTNVELMNVPLQLSNVDAEG